MTFGGKGETSFCFFPYLSYVFLGYVFGKILRRIGGFAAFGGFSVKGCLIWSVIVLVVTDLLVQGYISIVNKIKSGKN